MRVLETFEDGSTIQHDDSGAWQCNMRTVLVAQDGSVIRRGPEWAVRLIALRRGLSPAVAA